LVGWGRVVERENRQAANRPEAPCWQGVAGGSGTHFHTYWGLVRVDEYDQDVVLYPYFGFDWYLGKKWSISAVLPWPTVNYAPSEDTLLKLGGLLSASEWAVDNNGEILNSNFDKWDFGLSYEQRLWGLFWGGITVGYSGLGKFSISSNTNLEYETDIEQAPFVRLSFNLRLE